MLFNHVNGALNKRKVNNGVYKSSISRDNGYSSEVNESSKMDNENWNQVYGNDIEHKTSCKSISQSN